MQNQIRSTQSIYQFIKWRIARRFLEYKQNKLLRYYQKQKYDKLVKLFKTQKDYQQITVDSFPFLYFMISQNNVKAVKEFVEKYKFKDSMMIDDANPLKCTPIQYAILENKQDIEDVFLQNGGNIHIKNSQGQNAMHLATIYKRKEAFDLCIKRNIDYNQTDIFGNTPFHYACRAGSVEMITSLIAAKAKKIQNNLHQYPIHMAIQSGKLQSVLLLENDIMRPYPKFHPIHSAARSNYVNVFKYVYQKNPKFILQKDVNQSTPLHHAISLEDVDIVKFILERLPKVTSPILDAKDSFGNTPAHLAFLNSNIQILRLLVQKKVNLTIKNNDDLTPLDYGLTSQNENMKRFMLDLQGWKFHNQKNH